MQTSGALIYKAPILPLYLLSFLSLYKNILFLAIVIYLGM